jgi:putative intracellular protease/amidase
MILVDLYQSIVDTLVQLFVSCPFVVIASLRSDSIGNPGFPVEVGGVGEPHAAFLTESRTREPVWCHVQEIRVKCATRKRRMNMKILMVLTSHDQLGNTGRKTGFWLEEFAAPYFVFRDAGVQLTLASPKGGQPPVDPKSDLPENQTSAMSRFKQDEIAKAALAHTVKLEDVKAGDFDTVFYVGGHGPLWDLAESRVSVALLESFYNSGKPIALVCHSPGVLRHVTYKGEPLVRGKHVTGFTNGEEEAVQLTHVVPFLVEDELLRLGAIFEKVADWQPFSVVDGRLITGQNPASSTVAAQNLINLLARKAA